MYERTSTPQVPHKYPTSQVFCAKNLTFNKSGYNLTFQRLMSGYTLKSAQQKPLNLHNENTNAKTD